MENKIIVAVSGGPDSMALLDILRKQGNKCVVAHVNYQLRDTALRDQNIIEDYCKKHKLILELSLANNIKAGNFQAEAREHRYNFMQKLAYKHDIKDVYVGHHQDDVLETYLMQKQRNITPDYYGIKESITYKDINIIRPLLNCTKEALISYCLKNNVQFGVDESNLESHYKRNKIRNEVLSKLPKNKKADLILEITSKNKELEKIKKQTKNALAKFKEKYYINNLLALETNLIINVLRLWFSEYNIFNISDEEFLSIIDFIKAKQNNEYLINKSFSLFKEYETLVIASNLDYNYNYTFNEVVYKDFKHFKITSKGTSFEGVTVSSSDFPITIRNFKDGDTIRMKYGRKKVSRWFIDNKIGLSQRRSWPIVLNRDNEIILVPEIGCNITHFSNNCNMFVVK